MMKHTAARISLGLAAVLAPVVVTARTRRCGTELRRAVGRWTEHAVYGSAWGHDLIAFLATHPEVLQQFGVPQPGRAHQVRRGPGPEQLPARSLRRDTAAPWGIIHKARQPA